LTSKRAELVIAQERYQSGHPDLLRLQKEVAGLEEQQRQIAKIEQPNDPKAGSADQMKTQMAMANQEIKMRQGKQVELENRIHVLQGKLDILPSIEQQYQEFSRDYGVAKDHYQTLLLKKNASSMAADVEHQAQGEQFRVIDPASYPQKPYKPDLTMLNGIGLVLGLAIGGGLGFMQEYKDRTMHSDKDMRFYLPIP